ncbi:hypothetical protein FGE12_27440 [Aggregicoccus sp. 17bor-14]|uniref:hypothetical protein n=1 Tax=Myxococcaceae TaxID=31 RepID=UPI00129C2033|nr:MULTISPECIES: hypothetical protein [Myxococcaceae]MBF5046181.1 hypothetical protein [Simulacricoccus sp. 17bor-14]MRI91906.1 hypothetical protein [Aggregicoccus sp. 17bor-14]
MAPLRTRCAAVALGLATLLLSACGPAEELVLKEGQTINGLRYCAYGCPLDTFCAELFLKDTGRSPPICVPLEICDRFTCDNGGECRIFDTFPAEVRCSG